MTLQTEVDLSHHLTERVRSSKPSPFKALARLLSEEKDLTSLASGHPRPTLFPLAHATFDIPDATELHSGNVDTWKAGKAKESVVHFNNRGVRAEGAPDGQAGVLDLAEVLQYGLSNGFPLLVSQLEGLNTALHGRALYPRSIYISGGNTDALSKVFALLCEPDVDTILTEEFTFGSAISTGHDKGAKWCPIKSDAEGMIPEDLEAVLSSWDEVNMGKRPHLMYTVPCGNNPTGSLTSQSRYDAIYALCRRYDIIIVEDDPYYALQYTSYESDKSRRAANTAQERATLSGIEADGSEEELRQVGEAFQRVAGVRSFLARDVEGRVVRLDSFSKIFAPGIRLGWVTCNSLFQERLMRIGEFSTQVPNNLAQALVASYLDEKKWGLSGFIRWMSALRFDYQFKRDHFLDCFEKLMPSHLASTYPAGAGMFQWIEIAIHKHPRYKVTGSSTNTADLMEELWTYLIQKSRVVLIPASVFLVNKKGSDQTRLLNHLRATFSGDPENIEKGLGSLAKGLIEFFEA